MTEELRQIGIDVIGNRPWGTHFCHFYETRDDLLSTLVPYFKVGLENNEFCLWVISQPLTKEEAINTLQQELPDLDRYLREGAIEIRLYDEWYLKGGTFDRRRVIDAWKEKHDQALAKGYTGMRLHGNAAWLEREFWRDFSEYEEELNASIANKRMILFCTYPLAESGADELLDVAQAHQFVTATRHGRLEIVETPELKQAKAKIERLNRELEQRVAERTGELASTNEKLRRENAERKQAEEKLKEISEQLRALSARLSSAREEEGTRIARELHDELGSSLTSLKWDLEGIDKLCSEQDNQPNVSKLREKIREMVSIIDSTIEIVIRISTELRPSILDDLGLVAAIEWQAQQFEARAGITCRFDSFLDDHDLSREQTVAIFRILQEALTNILRHSRATRVNIMIEEEDGEVVLEVRDNGRGITEEERAGPRSLGLIGMQERAHLGRGTIKIAGIEGEGTVLILRIPTNRYPDD